MATSEAEFLKELRATFKVEAAEHLQTIATGLLELEKNPSVDERSKLIANIFRAAHSLKGAARATDFNEIEALCQSMEDRFASWKRGDTAPTSDALDVIHHSLNTITAALSAEAGRSPPVSFPLTPRFEPPASPDMVVLSSNESVPASSGFDAKNSDETVRIALGKLNALLVQAEELLMAKLTAGQRAEELRTLSRTVETWRNEWSSVEPEVRSLRAGTSRVLATTGVNRLLEFFDWHSDQLKTLENRMAAVARSAEMDRHAVDKLVDDLLEDSKKLLLLPFGTLVAPFPKLVRDLCRDQGKEADLVIQGDEVEIDKRILEEMKDPLVHLLRNCVDHGVEKPEDRLRQGKAPRATITLSVSPVNGSKVDLFVSDDGAGIDTEKVKQSAIKHGLLSVENSLAMNDAAAHRLIFQAEVSASPLITRVSGRGLGLAIVREKAEKLGGSVAVESRPGQGTHFHILVPTMLATFRGVLIEAAARKFIIPTFHVERVARVKSSEIHTAEGRETIAVNGRATALVRLADVLELPPADMNSPAGAVFIIVLSVGEQRIAFGIDGVLDEQEVLVKPLRKPLSRVRNISGATILGTGQVVPVLNVLDLLKSARKTGGASLRTVASVKPALVRSILVAEDSITSRMMLKGILESAGYRVKTAVDGLEAFTLLRSENFDLVVSDVEMPRLGGLDLTARIRGDRKLAEIPVVLVTTLETREDRERGVEVGASAYIIKSRFDQSDLLEAIRRLI